MPLTTTFLKSAADTVDYYINLTTTSRYGLVLYSGPSADPNVTYADLTNPVVCSTKASVITSADGKRVSLYARGYALNTSNITVNYVALVASVGASPGSRKVIAAAPITPFTFESGLNPGRIWRGRLKLEYYDKDNA